MKETTKKAKKSVPMSCVNKKSSAMKLNVEVDEMKLPSSLTELKYPESADFVEKGIDDTDLLGTCHIYPLCPFDQYTKTREAKISSSSFTIKDDDLPVARLPSHELIIPRAAEASSGSFGIDVEPPADQHQFDEPTKTRDAMWCRIPKLTLVFVLALLIAVPALYCKLSFYFIFLELLQFKSDGQPEKSTNEWQELKNRFPSFFVHI